MKSIILEHLTPRRFQLLCFLSYNLEAKIDTTTHPTNIALTKPTDIVNPPNNAKRSVR